MKLLRLLSLLLPGLVVVQAGTFKHITIDGSFGDWAGVPPALVDPADSTESTDYRNVYVAHDDNYLYVRFTLEAPGDPFTSQNNFFFDTDANPDTGYRVRLGSEMLVQGGTGYPERNGGFNEGYAILDLDWLAAPTGLAQDFEFRVSRHARFENDGTDVFPQADIALLLEAEAENFILKDTAPDDEGLAYNLSPAPPALTTATSLASLTGTSWRVNDAGTDPGSSWNAPDFDDSAWRTGNGLFGYSANPAAYPAPLHTALATGVTTVYLRVKFPWANDSAGLVFVATNYLSDGAIYYVNGAEIQRIRLPAGTVTGSTPATGGPAVPGQAEVFGFPGNHLIVGDNVIAVEVHQGADLTDLVAGFSFTATPAFAPLFTDSAAPADRSVVAGEATTFAAEYLASEPATLQWLKDGAPLTGATGATLTINPVLAADAGKYSLVVSNGLNVATTREATLTVTTTPVTITDATQPIDQTIVAGQPVTFTVVAVGSAPLSYQWTKDGFPITDATGPSLTLPAVSATDAGEYQVRVSNPVDEKLSRKAKLTVFSDTAPPTLAAVTGSPNQVTVTFSEAVDESSANKPANYTFSGGLSATTAARSAGNPAVVILTTTAQTLRTSYTLNVTGVADRFGNVIAAGASRSFTSTIVIDGLFEDWSGVALAHTDTEEAPASGTDFKDIWVTNDGDYLYIRFSLYQPGNPSTSLNNIFVDTDADVTTGYGAFGIGSEMLIQSGAGYQEKNGTFNEGGIDDLDFAMTPEGAGTEFELRISRRAKYTTDGQPVFVGDTIRFTLETENASFATTDTAPDGGGLEYILVGGPSELGALGITTSGANVVISWTGPGKLQVRPSLSGGEWTDVPGAISPAEITPGLGAQYYRLSE